MNLKERIDLILECLEKTGGPIIQSTEYKGYSVGLMLAGIKTNLNREKAAYPEEQLARLREKGLLEPKIEKLTDKAERVAEYVTKNPRLWHSDVAFKKYIDTIEDEEKRAEEIKAYQDAKEAYTYLRRRKTEGKLDEETSEILRQAGVGGNVFGYPEETTLFAQKTGISNREAQIIINEFGSLDNFRKEFIALMLDREIEKHIKVEKCVEQINHFARSQNRQLPFIQGFDMSQPNFLPSKDDINFLSILDENNSRIYGYFMTEERIIDYINSLGDEHKKVVIKNYFGLIGEEAHTLDVIGKATGFTRAAISDKVKRIKRELRSQRLRYQGEITEESRERFIERFFASNDIFVDGTELSQETKDELSQIYIDGLQAKRAEIERAKGERKEVYSINVSKRLARGEIITIDELYFSTRTHNTLRRAGYYTLNKILDVLDEEEITKIPKLGKSSLEEIRVKLAELGLAFTWETEEWKAERAQSEIEMQKEVQARAREHISRAKDGVYVPISWLDFSAKTREILDTAGYYDLSKLLAASKEEVFKIPSSAKIRSELHYMGCYFDWENKPLKEGEEITQINELGLETSTLNTLVKAGYTKIEQLLNMKSEKELTEIKGIGEKALQDIKDRMNASGFYFQWEERDISIPEENRIPWLFEQVFGDSMSQLDIELREMINSLILARQVLKEEQEACRKLGGLFQEAKRKELELIEKALASEGIEL